LFAAADLGDVSEVINAVFDGAVEVVSVVGFAGGEKDGDVFDAGLEGVVEAASVGDETPVAHIRAAVEAFEHLTGVGHLGDPARMYEGADLDLAVTGVDEGFDELDAVFDGELDGCVLESVAGSDLNKLDGLQ